MAPRIATRPNGFTAYGVDGCTAGWFVVIVPPTGDPDWRVVPVLRDLIGSVEESDRIFVDIPIGLPDGPDERECDLAARRELGKPRSSSVFRVPVREVLKAENYDQASKISRKATGKRVTKQSFAIFPKIEEVDTLLRCHPKARGVVREIHPEVCFAGLSGQAMKHSKRKSSGFSERRSVLLNSWPEVEKLIDNALQGTLRKHVARDDVLDAAVAALTACQDDRLLRCLGEGSDAHDLPMDMVYAVGCSASMQP